jgi:hypothetical protein
VSTRFNEYIASDALVGDRDAWLLIVDAPFTLDIHVVEHLLSAKDHAY